MRASIIIFVVIHVALHLNGVSSLGNVIYAVNCGGQSHVDSLGIKYQRDPLDIGTTSDYGTRLSIRRVAPSDQLLYQTERYHSTNFGYPVHIKEDGDYVLWLKFSEVWFNAPDQKVFNVALNSEHIVVRDLDIYDRVGRGAAHDEVVPFSVRKGELIVNGQKSDFDGTLEVEFVKVHGKDNPKCNAFAILKGSPDMIPNLAPLAKPQDELQEPVEEDKDPQEDEAAREARKSRTVKPSGPRAVDPYEVEDTSYLVPILGAVAAFIPILYCLCRM